MLGRVGLGLMLAGLAPHNQPDVRGSRISERHRRPGIGFQRGERRLCFAVARGGAYCFGGGGNGSRTGSSLIFARIALRVLTRGDMK